MNRAFKILTYILAGLFAAYSLACVYILPPLLKPLAEEKLGEALRREVTIADVEINPYALTIAIKWFEVKDSDPSRVLASFEELYVNLQARSLFAGGIIVKEMTLKSPLLNVEVYEDYSYNFSDLMTGGEPKDEAELASMPHFSLNNIQILDGTVTFSDTARDIRHRINDLTVLLPFLSTMPYQTDTFVEPLISGRLNELRFAFQGKTKPFKGSLETSFDIDLKDVDLTYYAPYIPVELDFKIVSGIADLKASVSYVQYRDPRPSLSAAGDIVTRPSLTLSGSLTLREVAVYDKENNLIAEFPFTSMDLGPSELFTRVFHVHQGVAEAPSLYFVRTDAGLRGYKPILFKLMRQGRNDDEDKRREKPPPLSFSFDEMRWVDASISFIDTSGGKSFRTVLSPLDVVISYFSKEENAKASYRIAFDTEAGERFEQSGVFTVNPPSSSGSLTLEGLKLAKYAPYYEDYLLFDIEDGRFGLSSQYTYSEHGDSREGDIFNLQANLRDLELRKRGEGTFLSVPEFSVRRARADLIEREAVVQEIYTREASVFVTRLTDGSVAPLPLFRQESGTGSHGAGKSSTLAKQWSLLIRDIIVDDYSVKVEDLVPSEEAHLLAEDLAAHIKNLSTGERRKAKISASSTLNETGALALDGSFSLNPPKAEIEVDLKEFPLRTVLPYLGEHYHVHLSGGALSTLGILTFSVPEGGASASYTGQISLEDFSAKDTRADEELLTWNSLSVSNLDFGHNPNHIAIGGIALTGFYSRIHIDDKGRLNLAELRREKPPPETKEEPEEEETKPPPGMPVTVKEITLSEGEIYVTDDFIRPRYSARLREVSGRVSGVSSEAGVRAGVDVFARLGDFAPLKITGTVHPFGEDFFLDLKADFRNIALSPLTPYSGKYTGYAIEKGKLTLDLSYHVAEEELSATNNIFISQFTFGERVESPHATSLPVRLAVALLKDRNGDIELDLPLSGSLEDPEFSLGKLVVRMLVNFLKKVATSPFALLGAMFGGGEELAYVEFEPGSHALRPESEGKLDTLVTALNERPALRLEIMGHVDTDADRQALRETLIERRVKAQKLRETRKKGSPAVPLDEVTVTEEEYEKYLAMAYKSEKFPKPRNILGFAKKLPAPEMERLMLTHIDVTDEDLRELSGERARAVYGYIIETGKVEPERVFLVEPEGISPEEREGVGKSRVDFRLR
jgi:hypothetical protein